MYTDSLIKIKNAIQARKKIVKLKFSRMDKAIIDVLERHGFVGSSEVKGRSSKRFVFVNLKARRPIDGLKFISKPSVRRYFGYREIRRVKGGHGVLLLSTPQGIITGEEARKEKVGGEALFEIW